MTLVTNNGLGTGIIYLRGDISRVGTMVLAPISTTNDNINNPAVTQIGDATNGYDGNLHIVRNTHSSNFSTGFRFAQHHETPDAVNFNWIRSRGTSDVPTPVVNKDELGELVFFGRVASSYTQAASIVVEADSPRPLTCPGKILFYVNNGVNFLPRVEINKNGELLTDTIGSLSTNTLTIRTGNNISLGNIIINQNGIYTASNTNLNLTASGTGIVSVVGDLSITGSVTLTEVLNMPVLNTAPSTPIAGMIAISSGLGWNPLSDGQQHMMVYLNGGWVSAA